MAQSHEARARSPDDRRGVSWFRHVLLAEGRSVRVGQQLHRYVNGGQVSSLTFEVRAVGAVSVVVGLFVEPLGELDDRAAGLGGDGALEGVPRVSACW